jgi:hypothetical protein
LGSTAQPSANISERARRLRDLRPNTVGQINDLVIRFDLPGERRAATSKAV